MSYLNYEEIIRVGGGVKTKMITPYYYFMNYNRQNTYYNIYSVEIRHHIFKGINKFKNSNQSVQNSKE